MSRNSSSRKIEISISNTLVCPFEVVDRVLKCSKLLEGLLSEFESSSLCSFDPNKTAILDAIKLKLEIALFQVNAVVDGSLINMDEYLKSKKQEVEFNFAITSREISNFRNIVSCYESIDVTESIQSSVSKVSNFRTPKESSSTPSRCKVLFDMTDAAIIVTDLIDHSAVIVSSAVIDENQNLAALLKASDDKDSPVLRTPLRSARLALKDTPLSPVGQRQFPISLSPDEVKENRHNRANNNERIVRSQTSLRLTRPSHLNVTAGRDHIKDENEV
jgi:hypothetical protein